MAGVGPSADAGVGGGRETMESILVGGERAKNGGDSAAAAAATDAGAVAVLADRLSA